jgi:DNA polymerase-3 subunit gamma/tau
MYAASQAGHHKVYIVDEAHMLTREAWNALLKILEEPPPGVVFVFATTEPQKIFNTAAPVLSRLQRFDFRRMAPEVIRTRLAEVLAAEGIAAEEDALRLIARHADGGMRDALSVLDQCLSFDGGTVTAARVRDTLGLIADELYAEVLRVVADRRPEAVFDLVGRLLASGADLTTFMAGVGELLRGLLMRRLGIDPADLTLAMRDAIEAQQSRFEPGDVVRMLRLLADEEQAIRRSGTPRLVVETLLLRWTLLDRTVDLEAVLAGGSAPRRPGGAPSGDSPPGPPSEPPAARPRAAPERADPPAGAEPPSRQAAEPSLPEGPLPGSVAFTVDGLAGVWEQAVEAGRGTSRFLAEALAQSVPVEVRPPEVLVELRDDNHVLQVQLERYRPAVESLLAGWTGRPVRLAVRLAGEPAAAAEPPRARRMSESKLRAERLEAGRKKDPALDTAADALDLEVVD